MAGTGSGVGAVPNAERGEVSVTLDGHACVLAPTFAALVAIEQRTGAGIVTLARRLATSNVSLGDVTAIVREGLAAAGRPVDYDRVGEMVLRTGLLDEQLLQGIDRFLDFALTGGRKPPVPGKNGPGDAGPGKETAAAG